MKLEIPAWDIKLRFLKAGPTCGWRIPNFPLEVKLTNRVQDYFNQHRSHSGLKGDTPIEAPESRGVDFKSYRWQKHCRGVSQTPIAA
jgi:hypothetical protein